MNMWFVFALMTVAAVFAVLWPLGRRAAPQAGGSEAAVYRDQLAEIDRDFAGGLIGASEAEAARVEIARRLLAASDRQRVQALPKSDIEGPATAAQVPQQRIHRVRHPAGGGWIPHPREPRAERSRGVRQGLQPRVELGAGFVHVTSVAAPSDIHRGALWGAALAPREILEPAQIAM